MASGHAKQSGMHEGSHWTLAGSGIEWQRNQNSDEEIIFKLFENLIIFNNDD